MVGYYMSNFVTQDCRQTIFVFADRQDASVNEHFTTVYPSQHKGTLQDKPRILPRKDKGIHHIIVLDDMDFPISTLNWR